jgi:hypothetical protein
MIVTSALVRLRMWSHHHRHWRPLARLIDRPGDAQTAVLRALLSANADTRFGREHGFAGIRDHETFVSRVPVQTYESLRPYVEEQRLTGAAALTAAPPVFYAQTSGSTGTPKYIPVTTPVVALYKAEQALFSYLQYRQRPEAFYGKALGIMGAAVEGHLDSGHVVGSVSGYLYQSLPRLVQSRFVVPPAVATISDYTLKYLIILRLALAEDDITYMGAPNPSTFLRLLDLLHTHRDELARSLETGGFDRLDALTPEVRAVVAPRMAARPARAAALGRCRTMTYAGLWPAVRLLTTWTGGSCGIALASLRATLPPDTAVMELGYQSTEFRGTFALTAETPGGLPPLHHHFFEFVDEDQWNSGAPEFLTLDRLRPGVRYHVLVTTMAGLYRYFMNDLVEVTDTCGRTPLLRFVQKGKGVTSLTGEKLYEAQVIQAVQESAAALGLLTRFFLMVADEAASAYWLCIEMDNGSAPNGEALGRRVDHRLADLNLEYDSKRESGRLGPVSVLWLKRGAGEAYKNLCVTAGQREGQFKPAVLIYRKDLTGHPEEWIIT